MRINSDDSRFSPQIAALAMPSESEFSKAAEGISNVGKVFQDQQDREQSAQLNALKMGVAQEELKSKQFDNSISGEEWDNKKTTYALERRNKTLEGLKKKLDYDSEVKKIGDSEVTDKIKGLLPSTMFYKDGKFDRSTLDSARVEWLNNPAWKGKEYVVNSVFDSKLKEITDAEEALLKNSKTQSEINNKNEDTKWIAPKANAEIAQKQSSTVKNYAGANLDNVNSSLSKRRVAAYEKQVSAQTGANNAKDKDLKKDRQKIVADGKLEAMIPKWGEFNEESQRAVINLYVDKGVLPTSTKEVVMKRGVFGDTMGLQPIYPKGSLPKTETVNAVPKGQNIRTKPKADYNSEIQRLLSK